MEILDTLKSLTSGNNPSDIDFRPAAILGAVAGPREPFLKHCEKAFEFGRKILASQASENKLKNLSAQIDPKHVG